ncbi:replication factor C small subunit [Klosneuvirus KNV1]|uniref:Replication factor C small subunit n=1 Tax=Klosneuvirus KNV1 TaxID=1977640 RepID=A0A1V0SHT4_9VIRU|nr:replication factor C small subunit [Klosneuvirus KNV1]
MKKIDITTLLRRYINNKILYQIHMFFVDKYSPDKIETIMFHKKELDILKKMAEDDSVPHIIFYGPNGSGKKSLINRFLKLLYNDEVQNLNNSIYKVHGSGNIATDVVIKQSNYHIVIEPNNNNFDRYLIQDVVKEYAKKVPLNVFTSARSFKTVLINNVDNMSYYAQTSLRRTMEKYSGTCRFIMYCKSLSRVIDPIRSRCYCFRINAPSDGDMVELIAHVACNEKLKLTLRDYYQIIKNSNGNIKKVLWLLHLKSINEPLLTSYDFSVTEVVDKILLHDLSIIPKIRLLLYDIMITGFVGTDIIKSIVRELFTKKADILNEQSKRNIVEIAAKYEHRLIKGRREIIQLDGFIIGLIDLLNKYNIHAPIPANEPIT